jgi:hypothetical protein
MASDTPLYFRVLARFLRPFPDFDFGFIKPVRARAVAALRLGEGDRALMFAAPDVYASPAAWTNLRRVLRPGARVAFFGAKTSRRRGGWLLNGVFRAAMPRLSFDSTPVPTDAPWALVEPELAELEVHEYFGGWMFLATGTWAPFAGDGLAGDGPQGRTPMTPRGREFS